MVFAYCLHVEVDIEAQTDTTFFPGAAALRETHGANGDPQPLRTMDSELQPSNSRIRDNPNRYHPRIKFLHNLEFISF